MNKIERTPLLEPARIITSPGEQFSLEHRLWQGCPTIERTPGGRLWAGWYSGGPKEPDELNYNILACSDDDGQNWHEPVLIIDSIPEMLLRAIDIQLWTDPGGKLWVFWTETRDSAEKDENGRCLEYCDAIFGTWAITCEKPDADQPEWSKPVRISDGFLRCRPTVLSDGRWIMCSYDWISDRYAYSISTDQGSTWSRHYGAVKVMSEGHNFDETMVVELQGNLLWMLARTKRGALAQSFSYGSSDRWTPSGLSELKSPTSRFWIGRLASGRLLLINHLNFTGRSHLTALLSDDEGQTWPYSLLLDGREQVSYPDAIEYPDGKIACVHDYKRIGVGEINLSFFREEDILAGKPVSADCILSRKISGIEPVRN
ncbi:MAG: sialidase family protein [Bacillota bacterium]|nr:sialidase family protein [Bacillota bacterium]